jgi:hypothetical protein
MVRQQNSTAGGSTETSAAVSAWASIWSVKPMPCLVRWSHCAGKCLLVVGRESAQLRLVVSPRYRALILVAAQVRLARTARMASLFLPSPSVCPPVAFPQVAAEYSFY